MVEQECSYYALYKNFLNCEKKSLIYPILLIKCFSWQFNLLQKIKKLYNELKKEKELDLFTVKAEIKLLERIHKAIMRGDDISDDLDTILFLETVIYCKS